MSSSKNKHTEFYIGWLPQAPATYSRHVKKVVIGLCILVVCMSIILAVLQKRFSTASFEFGQITQITGVYQSFPVPAIRVSGTPDLFGRNTYITIPLVGYGKFGAEGVIRSLEEKYRIKFDGQKLSLAGTLLYSDGKTFLQVDANDKPLRSVTHINPEDFSHTIKELGTMTLTGEVVDPKCYFGVMKPGQGKPHRDCAVRCISGGISPVLLVKDAKGATGYYLVLDENGNKMNNLLTDHVAEPIALEAKAVKYDDWIVLYVTRNSIRRTGSISWVKDMLPEVISCAPTK